MYVICWVFMLFTGLLLVEVNLSMPEDTSFITMAEKLLGKKGRIAFWVLYLFLFLTVMTAHAVGGGSILHAIPDWPFPKWLSAIIYSAVFMPVVYLGARSVDRLNLFLISGVIFFYLGFVGVSASSIRMELLSYMDWGKMWVAFPILFTAFTYQVIIPTLMTYLVWEFVILGIVPPTGTDGLEEALLLGHNAVAPLKHFVHSEWVLIFSNWFAFFALTASFIPLALSFFDFMADGLKWEKKGSRRLMLCSAVFGVPVVIAILYPNVFLKALGIAGGISIAFLFGLMPPVMAWISRYVRRDPKSRRQLPGGKPLLICLMAFSVFLIVKEAINQIF
jgi:tyrosine-specific transport protein